jgi:glycine/D-amino acid oxidase-like deaminating enzyme
VRGFETAGGHLAGAITERGRVACRAALLAGGAWSRLMLAQRGIVFPQLTVLSSNQRILARDAPLVSLWVAASASGGSRTAR